MEGTCASRKSKCEHYKDFLSSSAKVFQLSRKSLPQEKVHNLKNVQIPLLYPTTAQNGVCAPSRVRTHMHPCAPTQRCTHRHSHTWSLLHVPTHIQTVYTCTRVAVRPQSTYIANIRTIACVGTKKIMHEVMVRTPLEHQHHFSKRHSRKAFLFLYLLTLVILIVYIKVTA